MRAKILRPSNLVFILIIASIFTLGLASSAWAVWSNITRLTDNSYDDGYPQVSGNNVFWMGEPGPGTDKEIFFYNGSTVTQLTDNNYEDILFPVPTSPRSISGNHAVWMGRPGGSDLEILYYNGSTVNQLTNNSYDDQSPQISGNNIIWIGKPGGPGTDWEIFFFNGSTINQLTNNGYDEAYPQVSGNYAIWAGIPGGPGTDTEVFFFNGSTATQLTNNGYNEQYPQISGNNAVWMGEPGPGTDKEIFFYNGSTVNQLTNNSYHESYPQISGNNIVWTGRPGGPGTDNEVFFYNGSTVTQLTDNSYNEQIPQISGGNAAWFADVGTNEEIFFYNGSTVNQLTNNSYADIVPHISGGNVVWLSMPDGPGTDYEIFLAKIDIVAPRTKLRAPRYSTDVSRIRRFRVYWKATDPAPSSGLASYDVQYKVGKGGGWRNWLMNTKKNSSNFKGRQGKSYYFRARARDNSGNVGYFSGPRRTIVPHDNNQLIRRLSGFGHTFKKSGSRYYLGTVRYSTNAGDAVTYRFRGNSIAVISTKARNRSKAKIYVDGKYKRTVKTAIRRTKYRRAVYRQKFRKISRHTITIVNVGDRARLDLDGLAVGR